MKLYTMLFGIVQVEILGAEPELLSDRCVKMDLPLWDIHRADDCTLRAKVWERDLEALREMAQRCCCELRVDGIRGGSRSRRLLRRRRALLFSMLAAAALLLSSSLFIWEIQVVGCESLSQGQVLRALAECGVERGSFWPSISQDLVRSQILIKMPELAWMTVNVSGSRAVVLLKERTEKPTIYREDQGADIRASASGIVRSATVLNGHSQIQPGDAVLEGELLVSGTLESLTAPPRHVRASAEILADTWHELNAVCPVPMLQTHGSGRTKNRFALQIGKNRVEFALSPEKGLDECDKIVHEYNLGIKGLFALPVTLIRTEEIPRNGTGTTEALEEQIKANLLRKLQEQIDGEILSSSFAVSRTEELLVVTLRANCLENIAETVEQTP